MLLMLAIILAAGVAVPSILWPANASAAAGFNFSPKSGPPGTKVTVSVTGAPAGESLTVEGNGAALCGIKVGGNGSGECTFTVPKNSGNISLKITGDKVGSSDIGTFKVTNDKDKDDKDNNKNNDKDKGKKNNGNNGGNSHNRKGDNNKGAGSGRGFDPNAIGRNLLDRLGVPPAREFGEETDRARRALLCAVDAVEGAPLGCDLGGGPVNTNLLDASASCVSGVLTTGKLGGVYGVLIGLGLGVCDFPYVGPPPPEPPLTSPSQPNCAFGQPDAASIECLGELSPPDGNLTPTGPQPATNSLLELPEIQFVPPTFDDILGSLNSPSAAPSATLVQEKHDDIWTGVCSSLPFIAGGCK